MIDWLILCKVSEEDFCYENWALINPEKLFKANNPYTPCHSFTQVFYRILSIQWIELDGRFGRQCRYCVIIISQHTDRIRIDTFFVVSTKHPEYSRDLLLPITRVVYNILTTWFWLRCEDVKASLPLKRCDGCALCTRSFDCCGFSCNIVWKF